MAVKVDLDRERTLKFDIKAVRELEQRLGKPLGLVLSDIQNMGIGTIETALYTGLQHEDKGLSLSLTQKLFKQYIDDRKPIRLLIRQLGDAMEETGLFRTEDDEDAEGNAPPEQRMTN